MTVTPPGDGPVLLVTVEEVARRAGHTGTLTDDQRATVVDRIVDAQDDAAAHLGRSLFPTPLTLTGVYPAAGVSPMSAKAWPVAHLDDTVRVVDYRVSADGSCDVDVLVGLDGPSEPALVRFVRAHAVESFAARPAGGVGARVVSSVNAGGQSISYASAPSARGAAGGPVTTDSLDHLRRFSVSKPNLPVRPPWPYSSVPVGYRP